jgi:hypothetical protein
MNTRWGGWQWGVVVGLLPSFLIVGKLEADGLKIYTTNFFLVRPYFPCFVKSLLFSSSDEPIRPAKQAVAHGR